MLNNLTFKIDRHKLPSIVIACFSAPVFYYIFINTFHLYIDGLIGYTGSKPSIIGVLGCPPEYWMYPVRSFSYLAVLLIFMLISVHISKKGFQKGNFTQLVCGAFLFFPVANFMVFRLPAIFRNPIWFVKQKQAFLAKPIPILSNFYVYRWIEFFLSYSFFIVGIFIVWKIIFRFWDKDTRLAFFIFGSMACLLGYLCWFFVLGPRLFPFPFRS
jgi:hypothetical protein